VLKPDLKKSPSTTKVPAETAPAPSVKPRVNNVTTAPSQFCCGMVELGNFNYVDPPGGKKMTHYHKIHGSWAVQQNNEPTTKADVLERMGNKARTCYMCTTGAGQEYMEPILQEIGFYNTFTFINPDHAKTPVKLWVYSENK
jgi:hypothetical protein